MEQNEVREHNLKRVIWSAQSLFIYNGVAKTTISQIAAECGLSDMSVYRYFGNKKNLVDAVWKESLTEFYSTFERELEKKGADNKPGYEQFLDVIDLYVNIYTENPKFFSYTQEMFMMHAEEFLKNSYMGKPLPMLKALLKGTEDGSIRNDVNIYEVYQLLSNVYTGVAINDNIDQGVSALSVLRLTRKMLAEYLKSEKINFFCNI